MDSNKKYKSGVSLLVLLITIVVMIILAATVIMSAVDKNPINKAKEVTLKSDIDTFMIDFNAYIDQRRFELIAKGEYYDEETDSNLQNVTTYNDLKNIIPSFLEKYENIFGIVGGKFTYIGTDKSEEVLQIINDMGVYVQL